MNEVVSQIPRRGRHALAAGEPEGHRRSILDCLLDEESVRVKHRIVDGFISLDWAVPEEKREAVRKVRAASRSTRTGT